MKNNILKVFLSITIVLMLSLSNSLVGAATPCTYDFDSDGDVDASDLVAFMSSGGDLGAFVLEFGREDCSIVNTAPTATDVSISGTPEVDQVLTGNYTYSDDEGDLEGVSTFKWFRGSVEIAGATAQTYPLVYDDVGAMIVFEVTPVAQTGESPGTPEQSTGVGPVIPPGGNYAPEASLVFISGTAKEGQILTGNYTYTDVEIDPEGDSTFKWFRGSVEIAGATAQTYTLVGADVGATIIFEVTPVALSGTTPGTAVQSDAVGPVSPAQTPPTATGVSISGTPEVDQILTGNYTYSDEEGDLEGDSTFKWFRGSVEIIGATAQTYPLVGDDLGAMIIFEVTPVAQSGITQGTAEQSDSVGPVVPANTPPTATDVTISGTTEVNKVLTGNYTYNDADADAEGASTFRWLRNGVEISGATAKTYTLVDDDAGAMIIFEVIPVAQTGVATGTAVQSGPVGPVASAPPTTFRVYDFGDGTGVHHAWGTYTDYWSGDLEGIRRKTPEVGTEVIDVQTDAYERLAFSDATGDDSDTNRYINPDEGSGDESTLIVEFNITEYPDDDIYQLDVQWEGYGDENHHMELYIWNYVEGNWGDGLGNFGANNFMDDGSGSTDIILSGSVTANVHDYISPTGEVTLLIYDDVSSEESFHDYVGITVHTTTLPMLTMAENPASSGKTVPEFGTHVIDPAGTSVDISATSYAGCEFSDWTGGVDDPNSASTAVTVNGDMTVTANYTALFSAFLSDMDFEASADDNDLRINDAGQDWYESRQDGADGPMLLSLDTTNVAGNVSKKAKITGSTSLNTYMSQEFGSAQTDRFAFQWDIYVDEILDISDPDRSAFMFIGDGGETPNSTSTERFVYMAFYKDEGGGDGTMDLMAVEQSGTTMVAEGLNLDQWYTIKVVVNVPANTYTVYIDDVLTGVDIPAYASKTSVTHVTFASWNDGAGSFYVDNVTETEVPNVPPKANDVNIRGTVAAGQILTGNYTYYDADGDAEGGSTFHWLRDDVEIPGATAQTYTLVGDDEGATIVFEVTPVAQTGITSGTTVQSAAVGYVAPASTMTDKIYDFGGVEVHHAWGTYTDGWSDLEGIRRKTPEVGTEVIDVQTDAYERLAFSDAEGDDSDSNRYINPDEGSGDESTLIVEFNITEYPDDIYQLDVQWEGYGDENHHMELYIWNYVEGNWGDGQGNFGANNFMDDGSGSADIILSGSVTANIGDYISPTGEVTLLIYDDASSEDSFHDYVGITVHTTTLPVLIMAENPASSGKTVPEFGAYVIDPPGTSVDISATSYAGCEFSHWTGGVDDPDSASTAVTVNGDMTVTANFTPRPLAFVSDIDFNASADEEDFRIDDSGQDWYESRDDMPTLLFLDESNIGGNVGRKAGFIGSESGNAYMSQEFGAPQTGTFSIQYDIYVDEILDISDPDRTGWTMIGDDDGSSNGPNSTASERFVLMAFYRADGADPGTMDLVAREAGQGWDGEEFTKIATGLNIGQWYTIKVMCYVPGDVYMVYVDGVFQKTLTAHTSKDNLTHISFATWNDGAGTFYVDNVMEVENDDVYTLTVNPSPNGTVTLGPPGGVYPVNTTEPITVALTPVPNAGWLFNVWGGDLVGGANPAMITMDSDKEVTPYFIEAYIAMMHVTPTLLDFGDTETVLYMDVMHNGAEGADPFTWTATSDQPWVTEIIPSGPETLNPNQSSSITVTIDRDLIGAALPDDNCRMWGAIGTPFTGIPEDAVYSDLYSDPTSLRILTTDYNEEGWGLAYYSEFGDVPVVTRGSIQAILDVPKYDDAVDAMKTATPKVALAHVRNCTSGCCVNLGTDIDDPHPFYRQKNGKTWLFQHNGGINKDNLKAAIDDVFEGEEGYYPGKYLEDNPPNGSGIPLCDPLDPDLVVDSELYFLLVLANIEHNNWSVEKGIIETARLSLIRNSTSNFIMTDGYTIWALRSGHNLGFKHDPSGYSVVSSVPPEQSDPDADPDDIDPPPGWTIMSNNELVILRPGQAPKLINVMAFMEDKYAATIYVDNDLGESVEVQVVAEGPEGIAVPDVVGMTQAEAEAAITAAGLVLGNVTVDYSVAVPPDTVIYSDPPAGSYVVLGSAVDCVVNLGPVIVDNDDADNTEYTEPVDPWKVSSGPNPIGVDSWYNRNGATFTWYWTPDITAKFDVAEWHTIAGTRNPNAEYRIQHADGVTIEFRNQRINGAQWNVLGSFNFEAGVEYSVTLIADGSDSTCADAIRFTKTGVLRHKFTTTLSGGGQIMPVMGDIDNDGDQEIVMAAGGHITAVNGKTGAVEWSVSGGADTAVELADLNNDGTPEILHGMSGPRVRALRGNGTTLWTSNILSGDWMPMFPILAFDITGNGLPEIWFSSEDTNPDDGGLDGALTMLNSNGAVLRDTWVLHPCWGGMALANTDNDNYFELYIGDRRDGYNNLPANGVHAFNAHDLTPLWERPDIHHSSAIPMIADVTGDGNLDVVATKITLSGPMILDPLTGATIYDYSNRNLPTHGAPTVYDIDEDGRLEFICSTSYPSSAPKKFVVFDLVHGTVDFEDSFDFWIAWSPKVGDVTGDGHMEILVATGSQEEAVGDTHNGSYPLIVYDKDFNMIDRVEHPEGTGQLTPARVYDTDSDGFGEVVVAGFNGYLMVYDTDAPTPDPAPDTWTQFYGVYRLGAAEWVAPPEN